MRARSPLVSRTPSGGGAASLLAGAGRIACTDARLRDAFACPWTPPSASTPCSQWSEGIRGKHKLVQARTEGPTLERLGHQRLDGFCQVVEAETLIRQAGASPRSYPPFRRPAPYPLFRPNSRIDSASPRGTPPLTANAVVVGSVGQWGRMLTKIVGHAPLT